MKLSFEKFIYCDFEFHSTNEENLHLVCCTLYKKGKAPKEFWLNDSSDRDCLIQTIERLHKEGHIFCAWAATAEARSFYSLGFKDPTKFRWIDLKIEYQALSNHNDNFMYGDQLKNGRVKRTKRPPPKWERTEEDDKTAFKQTFSLVEATYKLTGEIRDERHKEEMRDIILSKENDLIESNKKQIVEYCTEDVVHLPEIHQRINDEFITLLGTAYNYEQLLGEQLWRGNYAALTAIRESRGYPINVIAARNFSRSVSMILEECQREINRNFPDILPFKYNLKERRFNWNQVATKKWIRENCDVKKWKKTASKDISLSLEAFEQFFPFKHDYPIDNFGAQMVRYLKLKQSLYGFVPSIDKTKATFWDSVGSDGWVRPYMGIYNSQSSRSQPKATSFIPLKPAWMRSLIQPPPGYAITALDYGSEEFFVAALLSMDRNMIESYLSGDVYFSFAGFVGLVPMGSKRDKSNPEWEFIRDYCKSTCVAKGTLIRVRGFGFKKIEDIVQGDVVWDGEEWRKCEGSKFMGIKEVVEVNGTLVTPDHRILGKGREWVYARDYAKKNGERKVHRKESRRLRGPCLSWTEIWKLGSSIFYRYIKKKIVRKLR